MQERALQIAENIKNIKAQMAKAAEKVGRDPAEITLIAASKTQSSDAIQAAIAAGITVCGENRVQELLPHLEDHAYAGAQVHFIGQLQTNKVRQIVGEVALIQSVDSERLVNEIAKQAQKRGIVQDILLEVNIGKEANKGGVMPDALPALAEHVKNSNGIRLRGLMCIPPADASESEIRSFFVQTRQLFVDTACKMGDNASNIDCLSMGMSSDFSIAIEEGATMVRVGTAVFGAR